MKPPVRLGIISAALVVIGLSIHGWHRWPICPMRAVESDFAPEPRLHERTITTAEMPAFVAVLTEYGEPHSESGDTILITPRLYFDRELRWNYTSKR